MCDSCNGKEDPNETLKKYETDKLAIYREKIEHLEEQYLIKLLKPENRVDLRTLLTLSKKEVLQDGNYIKKLKIRPFAASKTSVDEFTSQMIENLYLMQNNKSYSMYFYNTLLTQPIRSVLQVFLAWDKNGQKNTEDFTEKLKHIFFTTLKKKLEPYGLLDLDSNEQLLNALSIYVINQNISRDNHLKLIQNS